MQKLLNRVPRSKLAVWRDDPQRLLPGEGLFAQLVPALVELEWADKYKAQPVEHISHTVEMASTV